jgi:hypothetical protein
MVYEVKEGFIHCYRDPYYFDKSKLLIGVSVFECIIPKGTEYYTGNKEICASKIIILKEL